MSVKNFPNYFPGKNLIFLYTHTKYIYIHKIQETTTIKLVPSKNMNKFLTYLCVPTYNGKENPKRCMYGGDEVITLHTQEVLCNHFL